MLLIPFDRPIDWRRPPLVTFTLLVVNVLVFLLFQLDDGREIRQVKSYYYQSGLAAIELPHYREHLQQEGADEFLAVFGEHIDESRSPWFEKLLGDGDFLRRLADDEVITPDDPDYRTWKEGRAGLAQRLDGTTVWGRGLVPAESEPATFLSHMFLHGGWFHLIGNMIFLVALGLLVEVALGSMVMTGLYLLSGIGAAGLFIALQPGGLVPMVGASGAISGLMGLCGVLYGRRPIRFFYFIGVYFDYVKAPALVLLALWLGKELFEYLRLSDLSNVAYAAHIGGLLTGALAGAAVRFGTSAVDEEALDERERTETFERRLGEANERLAAMEPERARPLFERMARDYPGNVEVLDGLFRSCRFAPASEAYHDVVQRVLRLEGDDEETRELVLTAFRDYRERARPKPRFSVANIRRMIDLLLRHGNSEEVAPLVHGALKQPEKFPGVDDQALRLANRLGREGRRDLARQLYTRILRQFPATPAARQAERVLTSISS